MSSLNPHYTFNYAQPSAYRFSHDSVFLARRAFEAVGAKVTPRSRVLDLCAGCGIVGLEFLWHVREAFGVTPAAADFVEVQREYAEPFAENVRRFGPTATALTLVARNYAELQPGERYDVILCNPPYFRVGEGKLPPSRFKARCRFFVDAGWEELSITVGRALGPGGDAFVLSRDPRRHALPGATRARDVRGTALWHLRA